jgi:hypothetical protein
MHTELQLPDKRPTWRGFLVLGIAGSVTYAAVALVGEIAIGAAAGLTAGYLFARVTKW